MQLSFRQTAFQIANAVNVLLFLSAIGLGFYSNTLLPALIVGIPALAIPFLLYRLQGDTAAARIAFGIAFMIMTALHIHQSLGFTEVHFGIFALLAILVAFRDWKVIAAAALVIAVHHLLFMYLQKSGVSVFILPTDKLQLDIILLHALYVVVEAAVLIVIAKKSLAEAEVAQAFINLSAELVTKDRQVVLTQRLPDLNESLVTQFNGALEAIHSSIKTLGSSILQNRQSVNALKEKATQLTDGIKEQHAETSAIATATEQMSMSIKETQGRSQDIASNSSVARKQAEEGQHALDETQSSVAQLAELLQNAKTAVSNMSQATSGIKNMLDVINGIADQTNLLALNAAIEAARAGDSGRGFAVVADEVRQLASKTQESTTQIEKTVATLLQTSSESVHTVDRCLEQLTSTERQSKTSRQLLGSIKEQTELLDSAIHEVTTALEQQSIASRDISASTQKLNNLADDHIGIADESTQAADEVAETTESLAGELKRFRY
ncbi:methyl-accepting chemotaxis protein [Idiomarina seosinensis]|uniref:methyl-accepting chemotaxis protein n=1 Tax=Idiomarina seosinensis TaxID=281739 RepID=UPI00384F2ADF